METGAARAGVAAGPWVRPGRAFPVAGTARLVFAAGGRERIWPTCHAAMPPVASSATVVTMAVIVIPWPGDSRDRRTGRAAPLVSGGPAPGSRGDHGSAGSSAAGSAPTAQGGLLAGQGGMLSAHGGMLAGQGDPSGSRDGWRADQAGSAGGS